MSSNYSFVGEINRSTAMSSVADTMNELNLDILKATMEMGGKQVILKDANAFSLEKLDASEIREFREQVDSEQLYLFDGGDRFTLEDGQFEDAGGVKGTVTLGGTTYTWDATENKYMDGANELDIANTVPTETQYTLTTLESSSTQIIENVCNLLGIHPETDIEGGSKGEVKVSLLAHEDKSVTFLVAYQDKDTGKFMQMGARVDENGRCIGFSELEEVEEGHNPLNSKIALDHFDLDKIIEVDGAGLLESWGINDPQELQPGDLFLIQQKLQIIKDTVSAVHTTGKTQGDIMREATQKFSQG
jgi:hypothetical protein